jgi:hypothetical protein
MAMFTVACARITVNVYFPAAAIKDAPTKIEREVRGEKPADPQPSPPSQQPQSFRLWPQRWRPRTWHVRVHWGTPSAAAQAIDIDITTPAIRSLIASRKQRYPSLVPLFAKCTLGETNRGLVDIRAPAGLSLQDKARVKSLHDQENRDRQQLYRELAKANDLPPDREGEVAGIFANVNRREARGGWCIQDENNSWKKK